MTSPSPQPPAWAQSWIEMLAPAGRRDSILGDLLEEYHEAQVPARGVAAADRWFAGQARGFLWSASLLPGVLFGAVGIARTLLDVAVPTPELAGRAAITTYAVMAIFALAGLRLGLSTRRVDGAFLVAPAVTIFGLVPAFAAALAALGSVFVHPSAAARAALWEATDIPVQIILPIGIVLTLLGAVAGRIFPKRPFQARA